MFTQLFCISRNKNITRYLFSLPPPNLYSDASIFVQLENMFIFAKKQKLNCTMGEWDKYIFVERKDFFAQWNKDLSSFAKHVCRW